MQFDRLYALEQFGIKLGLDNIGALAAALDHPERAYATLLIAGTNGKGSVAAMVERALRAAGHRTGRYTSPHLVRLEERFAIDGRPVDTATLSSLVDEVLDVEARARREGRLEGARDVLRGRDGRGVRAVQARAGRPGDPRSGPRRPIRCDEHRLAAGDGHRLDRSRSHQAARFVDLPTSRSRRRARCAPAPRASSVSCRSRPFASSSASADEVGATLVHAAEGVVCGVAEGAGGVTSVDLETPTRHYGPVPLGLAGAHQVGNALVAVRMLEALDAQGWHVDARSVETGLRDVDWPGRLQLVQLGDGRQVLLDAAHNPAGARALASHLTRVFPDRVPLVFGVSADKDAAGMLDALAPVVREIVATEFRGSRARPAADDRYHRRGQTPRARARRGRACGGARGGARGR